VVPLCTDQRSKLLGDSLRLEGAFIIKANNLCKWPRR